MDDAFVRGSDGGQIMTMRNVSSAGSIDECFVGGGDDGSFLGGGQGRYFLQAGMMKDFFE